MKGIGIGLVVAGLLLGLVAAGLEVTVGNGTGYGDRLYNNGLIARRELMAIFAVGIFLAGAIFTGSGHLAETITNQRSAETPAAARGPSLAPAASPDSEIEVAGVTVPHRNGKYLWEGVEYATEFDARRAVWRARHLGQTTPKQ